MHHRARWFVAFLMASLWILNSFGLRAMAQESGVGEQQKKVEDRSSTLEERIALATVAAVVSLLGAATSALYARKSALQNRQIADRTVTVEAQKLLLEINKQYISDPNLFAIYDDHPGRDQLLKNDPKFLEKIKAMGYLKLNVFEVIFEVLPNLNAYPAWAAYFEDSIRRCSVLRDELSGSPHIYNSNLIAEYRRCLQRLTKPTHVAPSSTISKT
jgi:hypothetical protein